MNTAETILAQFGGAGRLSAMLGAKQFVDTGDGLQFKFAARALRGVNCIVVSLDPSDTYTVRFVKVRRFDSSDVETVDFVYADQLRAVVENHTGLRLSL